VTRRGAGWQVITNSDELAKWAAIAEQQGRIERRQRELDARLVRAVKAPPQPWPRT